MSFHRPAIEPQKTGLIAAGTTEGPERSGSEEFHFAEGREAPDSQSGSDSSRFDCIPHVEQDRTVLVHSTVHIERMIAFK